MRVLLQRIKNSIVYERDRASSCSGKVLNLYSECAHFESPLEQGAILNEGFRGFI
jgi:hypothetical protein